MKPGVLLRRVGLRRSGPLRRRPPQRTAVAQRVDGEEALYVFQRDNGCIAYRLDAAHQCEGRLTLAHVPELGKNAEGKKPPFDRWHLVTECWGANSGGLNPWSETHRHLERKYLRMLYPDRYDRA